MVVVDVRQIDLQRRVRLLFGAGAAGDQGADEHQRPRDLGLSVSFSSLKSRKWRRRCRAAHENRASTGRLEACGIRAVGRAPDAAAAFT